MTTSQEEQALELGDWGAFLHEQVRSPELRRLPPGARTVLSGGAAGSWYFEWFNANYPTAIERHIAVEAFAPQPEDLPAGVEWLERTLGDLEPVGDNEVDLVYGGEVLEHLWPDDVARFLLEAQRVLRVGGTIALDSPNRRVTTAIDWLHPEHTVEFTVDEAVELLEAAGFTDVEVRGGWLTYDRESHRFLALDALEETGPWPWRRRVEQAAGCPDDSFIWWAVGTKHDADPDAERVRQIVWRAFSAYRAFRFSRLRNEIGRLERSGDAVAVVTDAGQAGRLVVGPNVPMPPGGATAHFHIAARGPDRVAEDVITLEIGADGGSEPVAQRGVTAAELPADGSFAVVDVPFELERTTFGVEFRVTSTGRPNVAVGALLAVDVEPATARIPAHHEDSESLPATPPPPAAAAETATPPRPSFARRLARMMLWPTRRFFDPRFAGIEAQIAASQADHVLRFAEVRQQTDGQFAQVRASLEELVELARTDLEIATDATTLMGEAVADVSRAGYETLELVRELHQTSRDGAAAYIARLVNAPVEELEGTVVDLLNYAGSHRGFAAQRNLWFNPAVSLTYRSGDVAVGAVNERVVELPYVLRALADVPAGGAVLDVGATESLLSFELASLGYAVTAVDPRPYPLSHPRLEVVTAEIQHWEPNKSFDAVVCLSTIEHIGLGAYGEGKGSEGADVAAMARIRECTSPGGVLVLTTPYGKAMTDAFSRVYDRAALETLLTGWEILDLTVARRQGPTDWVIDSETTSDEGVDSVALVTARRAG